MARDVYSIRIFSHGSVSGGLPAIGPVVPVGFVYVVRDIDVWDNSALATNQLLLFSPVGGIMVAWFGSGTDALRHQQWTGRQVYGEGEQVGFSASGGSWSVTCSGYQLTLP